MPKGLTVAAASSDLEILVEVANSIPEITLTGRRPIDGAGDGLAFPIDAGTALQVLEVIGAIGGSVEALRLLLDSWSARRNKRREDATTESPQVLVCDLKEGTVLYSGKTLDASIVRQIMRRIDETDSPT